MPELADLARALPEGAGPLGLFSSDEFLSPAVPFDRRLVSLAGPRVALVLCADHRAWDNSARLGLAHFRALGADPFVLDLHEPGGLPDYDVLYMGGGSPPDLVAHLRDTGHWDEVLARWRNGKGLAGSSAGAMAMCEDCVMPVPGARVPTEWSRGMGPMRELALAVHATSRSGEWLAQLAASAPCPLLALDDGTGVLLHAGAAEVLGVGRVWFVPNADE